MGVIIWLIMRRDIPLSKDDSGVCDLWKSLTNGTNRHFILCIYIYSVQIWPHCEYLCFVETTFPCFSVSYLRLFLFSSDGERWIWENDQGGREGNKERAGRRKGRKEIKRAGIDDHPFIHSSIHKGMLQNRGTNVCLVNDQYSNFCRLLKRQE